MKTTQSNNKQKTSVKTKSKKTTYSYLIATLAITAAFLPFIHDAVAKGIKGFFGFSSFRVMLWTISIITFGIIGWFRAFIEAKGKQYRFTYLVPILIASYQLSMYLLDARKTDFNQFNVKIIIAFVLIIGVVVHYFNLKRNSNED